jgi:hypothetical protein
MCMSRSVSPDMHAYGRMCDLLSSGGGEEKEATKENIHWTSVIRSCRQVVVQQLRGAPLVPSRFHHRAFLRSVSAARRRPIRPSVPLRCPALLLHIPALAVLSTAATVPAAIAAKWSGVVARAGKRGLPGDDALVARDWRRAQHQVLAARVAPVHRRARGQRPVRRR